MNDESEALAVLLRALQGSRLRLVDATKYVVVPKSKWRYMGSIRYAESCAGEGCDRILGPGEPAWLRDDGTRPRVVLCRACYEGGSQH